MKQQSVKFEDNINKRLNEIDERLMTFKEHVIESVEEQIKSKVTQIINNKVSGNYGSEYNNNDIIKNGDVIENVVSECDTLNNDSDDESLVGVEISDEVVVVNESEREREEKLDEYGGQIFPVV